MIISTSDLKFVFQKLTCIDPVSMPQRFELESFLKHEKLNCFLRNIVPVFPEKDYPFAKENIANGYFVNCFIYAGNKTMLLIEGVPFPEMDIDLKKDYLVVENRAEIISDLNY